MQDPPTVKREQALAETTAGLARRLESFLTPLLVYLDQFVDKGLVVWAA